MEEWVAVAASSLVAVGTIVMAVVLAIHYRRSLAAFWVEIQHVRETIATLVMVGLVVLVVLGPWIGIVGFLAAGSSFGQWTVRQPGMTYEAQADGFVSAHSAGQNPAYDFAIEVLDGRNGEVFVRTRGGRYDGTVSPVSQGDLWTVRSLDGGTVVVYWLPAD